MIGSNIKKLRTEKGLTQKELADRLFVSAQAVSRWEHNEVEPSLGTIAEMAKIFGVSTDAILGIGQPEDTEEKQQEKKEEREAEPQKPHEKEYVFREPPKQILALCSCCNSPIYEKSDIVRKRDDRIFCRKCDEEKRNAIYNERREKGIRRRILSFVLGPLASLIFLISYISLGGFEKGGNYIASGVFVTVGLFTLVSCLLLSNNFVGEMFLEIWSWGFRRMPGIIFSLDVSGCLWFITVKLLLSLLAFLLALACFLLAIFVGEVVSVFVYPYAIIKNYHHPEKTGDTYDFD